MSTWKCHKWLCRLQNVKAKLHKHRCRSSGKFPSHRSMSCSLQELDTAQRTLPPKKRSSAPSNPVH